MQVNHMDNTFIFQLYTLSILFDSFAIIKKGYTVGMQEDFAGHQGNQLVIIDGELHLDQNGYFFIISHIDLYDFGILAYFSFRTFLRIHESN